MAVSARLLRMSLSSALETARKAARLSQDDLWFLYKQSGGEVGLAAFKNYLRGLSDPQWHEYDIMAKVLNEALGEDRLPRLPFHRPPNKGGKWVARESNPEPTDRESVALQILPVAA